MEKEKEMNMCAIYLAKFSRMSTLQYAKFRKLNFLHILLEGLVNFGDLIRYSLKI